MASKAQNSPAHAANNTANNAGNNAGVNAGNAQNSAVNAAINAITKNGGAIKVVMPDQNGDFTTAISHSAVDKVQVVDVDMVLQLKDGTSVVLAGGAISAMDASHTSIKFNDGPQDTLSHLLDQVGMIAVPQLDQVLSSLQAPPGSTGEGAGSYSPSAAADTGMSASVTSQIVNQLTQIVETNAQSATIQTIDPTAQTAVLSQNLNTGKIDSQPLQQVQPPTLPERPGVIPQEHTVGPQAPNMMLSLVNLTTITQIGNVLFGSGGTPASATDASNNTQFASQVINAPADATEIHAISNIPPNDFIKVVNIAVTGDGIVQSVIVKGVPAGMSIANGTDMGGGNWSVPVALNQKSFDIQLEYTTTPADPNAPIHSQFSMEFDVNVTTSTGLVSMSEVKQFVVKDVNSANDLTYIDSSTGEGVYVLPAQGNSHIVHGGDGGVTIFGSNAADFLFGGAGADTINGGSGNSYFEGGAGADHMVGGIGINTLGYTLSTQGIAVDLLTGTGSAGDAAGDTFVNMTNVIGSAFDDTIVSGVGANNIDGGSGGSDTVSYAGSATAVLIDLNTGTGTGGNAAGDKLTHIQNVVGSAHNDTFIASTAANAFDGGGHDVNGADTVSYASDTSGNGVVVDLFNGSQTAGAAAGDTYVNIQNIIGTSANDKFIDGTGAEANRYDGGLGGQDTVSYENSTAGVRVNFVQGHGSGGFAEGDTYTNIQNVIGSAFDDVFTAARDSKSFNGGAGGIDTVDYSAADAPVTIDTINNVGVGSFAGGQTYTNIQKFVGSGSSDTFIASAAANQFDGGAAGSDTVDYSHSVDASGAPAGVTVDLFFTNGMGTSGGYAQGDILTNIENVIGSDGDDTFFANSVQNAFDGRGGNNTVSYAHSTSQSGTGVIVDLSATDGSGTTGNYALGDTFTNIQNVVGSIFNDTFVASNVANIFTGGGGSDTVSYATSTSTDGINGVTVDLSHGTGTGNFAQGDTYIGIQNVTGSAFNDTFIASTDDNIFTGGGGSDTVSYASSANAVTVDLVNGVGGGDAQGDTYFGIQNVIGSAQDDTFIDNGLANILDGGTSTAASHNRVSYANSVSSPGVAAGVTVDLNFTDGTGTSGGYATGDHLSNIQDITGSAADDTFVASLAANALDGGASTAASHNRVSYAASVDGGGAAAAVTVDLVNGVGTGGYAQGDTYTNIQDVTGGAADDTFIDSAAANYLDGGTSTATSHNRVSYADSVTSTGAAAGVIVDLNFTDGTGTSGGYATGDHLANIQDITGSAADDTFVASAAANKLDGGASTTASHNRVNYVDSVDSNGAAAAVTVDLVNGVGTGGYAQGDTYTNIQDVTGGAADDTFIASTANNNFDGGVSTTASHNTVSYALSGTGVVVDLTHTDGTGTSGGAAGDTFTNIQDVIGSTQNDTFVASLAANKFTGNGGSDTVSYVSSNAAVTVDLVLNTGTNGFADGDTYVGVQNIIGSSFNDLFYANNTASIFNGGDSTTANHNRVDFSKNDGTAVTVDLTNTTGAGSTGGAAGDKFINIQDVTGTSADDTFIASADANFLDGGTTSLHNKVSYAASVDAGGAAAGVTVDLFAGTGSGGYAQGDTYIRIQDVLGSAADDTFIASADNNNFDGGVSTASSHNRVSYIDSAIGVTVDLNNTTGANTSGGAAGDTFRNIQDLTGSNFDDLFIASTASNKFDGGTGSDTVSYAEVTGGTGVIVDLSGAGGTGGAAAGDTYISIENVIGSTFNDTFIDGSNAASTGSTYTGNGGVDTVSYAQATGVGVTVDLFTGAGSNGFATNDHYIGIQNVIGSALNDTFIDGTGTVANTYTGNGGADTISYVNSTAAVTVNLVTGAGTGGFAQGDVYNGVQNIIGSAFNDTFFANNSASTFNGGDNTTGGIHDRVDFSQNNGTAVTVDLSNTTGANSTGGAAGDKFINIEDLTGTSADDTFIASAAANAFDGGASTGASHNRVSYASSVDAGGAAAGVNVNLVTNVGTGGYAQGDTYTRIQDVTGSGANDTFVANAASNKFDGGAGSDTVDYSSTTGTAGVIVDLTHTDGTGTSGGLAQGDVLVNIENIIGTAFTDTFLANSVANAFDGGSAGSDTVSYTLSTSSVTASLLTGAGTVGDAMNDTYTRITNLTGGSGNDTLTGLQAGGSTLDGGSGSDTLIASGGNNLLIGGTGADSLTAGGDNNTFRGGAGSDTMTGNGGLNNTADYTGSSAGVTVNLTTGAGTGGDAQGDVLSGIQNVTGSANADTFIANSVANIFTGNGGIDTVSYVSSASAVTASLVASAVGSGGDAQGDTFVGITNLIGSAFNDSLTGLTGGGSTLTGGAGADVLVGLGAIANTASYVGSVAGVTVDLVLGTGVGGDAAGDTLSGIQNLIGGNGDDIFILAAGANTVDGGVSGNDTVSYIHETNNVTVDLNAGTATGNGTFGAADTLISIENATGGSGNDIFKASAVANIFDGQGGNNTVSYASNAIGAGATGVTVDFSTGHGANNWAAGDTYTSIQNVIGTAGNDLFVDSGDGSDGTHAIANNYNGGANLTGSSDTVDYEHVSGTNPLVISLDSAHTNSGGSAGDTFTNIENLMGSSSANTSIWGDGNANVLTAMGTTNTNDLHGGGGGTGTDILDGRLGGHNTMTAGATGTTIFEVNAAGSGMAANIDALHGDLSTNSASTLKMFGLGANLDLSLFESKVSSLTTLDLSGDNVNTNVAINSADIIAMGKSATLTIVLGPTDSITFNTPPGESAVLLGNGDYQYIDAGGHQLALLHVLHGVQ